MIQNKKIYKTNENPGAINSGNALDASPIDIHVKPIFWEGKVSILITTLILSKL